MEKVIREQVIHTTVVTQLAVADDTVQFQIGDQKPRDCYVAKFNRNDKNYHNAYSGPADPDDPDTANVVSSTARSDGFPIVHHPIFDLDIPAALIPSSTPGHSHLYLDVAVTDEKYWDLCHALANAGILEQGYVGACESRGFTTLRLPWVTKKGFESGGAAA